MPFSSLPSQTLSVPFAAGLNTKGDKRAKNPPMLDICKDVEFDDIGGLRTRYPYASLGTDIFGGGSLSNVRRIVDNAGELLAFTDTALYSWNAQLLKWVSKGTHLAIKLGEEPRFITTGDQVDADRAELSGTIVYSWTELVGANTKGYVAAIDKTTGNVLMTPTALAGSATRLRVTALTTKVLLTFYDGVNGLYAYALDPASPATALAGASTTVTNTNFGTYYDIAKVVGADQAVFASRRNPTTSYTVGTITAGLVVATSTKARDCDGPIAVACTPDGTKVQIARGFGVFIKGDLITISTLADTAFITTAIGTVTFAVTINQITAAFKTSTVSGQYRCHVFWSRNEGPDTVTDYGCQTNWVDTGGSLGTQSDLVDHTGVVSRAWCHNERIYVWTAFAAYSYAIDAASANVALGGFLQNTYFMFRDDGFLCAKATAGVAGGFAASTGQLPNVVSTDTNVYEWCGVERRRLDPGGAVSPGYGARAPRDISVTFDSNEARRCARLGRTLYITGGEILQYDGSQLAEVGFHVYPWAFQIDRYGAGGNLAAGQYAFKWIWRWDNARGERERSTTASTGLGTALANDRIKLNPYHALNITHKTTSPVAVEVYRSAVNPTDDAPFYLVTNPDPTDVSGDNCYIANDSTAMAVASLDGDNFADATATTKEGFYENGNVLENLAPPAATVIYATDTRLFLAGVAGDPDRVWYSKYRSDGEIAAFHDALTVPIPRAGGDITGLAMLNETLVVFRERAIYLLPGDGFDNTGGGANFGPARVVSIEVGAETHESIAQVPDGQLFKSSKGWYLLSRAWSVQYVGGPIAAYDSETPLAVQVMQSQHQVRILTSSRMLVWDYLVNQWGEWTIASGVDSALWNGTHYYATSSAVYYQRTDYTGVDYGLDVESAWIKTTGDLQGRAIVRMFEVLGEFRGACALRIRCARNYEGDGIGGWNYNTDKTWVVTPTVVGGPLQLKASPSVKRPIQAFKVRLTALDPDLGTPSGDTVRLTGLSMAVAIEDGLYSGLPAGQKQ